MTSILLMLLLSVIRVRRVSSFPSCPASCVVCSEDALICHRLAHIIDAPGTTQALLLTEGSISTVQPASLSDLSNVTVIGLSHNHISVLGEQSFRNLPFLHTLLLDHNLLTSQALQGGALANLTRLEVLALGHNLISMIQGGWFKGSKALRSLKLEGNLLTSLDSGSFTLNDLRGLESLDLSDNLIDHLHRNSFGGLVSLQTLDLSRNRLGSAPAEAFSYLNWLTNLNLDLNSWNCSCQLLELASFLSAFIQHPDKTLYNGRRMVCVSADNPAVTTVLELTEANCVPSNRNITVQIEARGGVTPQRYARDLAIAAVICFIGGVGLTLLVVLICYQVSRRKKLKESKRHKEEEEEAEGSSRVVNHHINHLDVDEKRRELWQAHRGQPWDREAMMSDARTEFRCPDCFTRGQRGTNPMRWTNRMNGGMEAEEERQKRRMRTMLEEERRRFETQQGIFNRDVPNKLHPRGNTNPSSHPRKETFAQRPETLAAHRTTGESNRTDVEVKSRGHETFHCESCHRTSRPPRNHGGMFDGVPPQFRPTDRSRSVNHNQSDTRRETRNVTFDLESLRSSRGRDEREEEGRSSRDKRAKRHKAKVQSSRSLKGKINVNPLRKGKVHPKRKTEPGHSEKSSSKRRIKDKSQDGEEKGGRKGGREGEREEGREGGREGERETKGSGGKMKKSTKTKESAEDGEEEKGDRGEGGQKSKTHRKGGQESTEGDEGEDSPSKPGDTADPADQSAFALPIGQGQNVQGGNIQSQGAGVPSSPSATGWNRATNLSLLGSAGSQLTGSSLSLQGGKFLLNTVGSTTLFPNSPANSVASSLAISGPNTAPSGAPDSFNKQPGLGLTSPATSLLANAMYANPLHTSQPAGAALSLAANPAVNPAPVQSLLQSRPPPDSSPLVARPAPEPGLQTTGGVHQSLDGLSGVTHTGSVTTVENLSNNNSQTEAGLGPGGSTVHMPAGGGAPTEGLPADASVSGVPAPSLSTQSVSSTGDAAAAALLQQEFLSEDGGSSPRRKLRLVLPEKTSSRPPTALERKIR